jgi:hypothetical protein
MILIDTQFMHKCYAIALANSHFKVKSCYEKLLKTPIDHQLILFFREA